jgi:hypothetical protein
MYGLAVQSLSIAAHCCAWRSSVPQMILVEGSDDGKVARKVGDVSVVEAGHRATEAIVNLAVKYLTEVDR